VQTYVEQNQDTINQVQKDANEIYDQSVNFSNEVYKNALDA